MATGSAFSAAANIGPICSASRFSARSTLASHDEALPSVDDYLGLVMQFIFAFGVAFLLPILLMLLERAGLVTRDQLKRGRRYAILLAFVVSAFITPPDVWSQCMLAVPLVLLYEITLIAIWVTERRRAKVVTKSEATASE